MRKEFASRTVHKTAKAAKKHMPWAAVVIQVDGGYMGFESIEDYQTWGKQK